MNFIFDPSLVLYVPLYKLDGVSFASRDAYGHLCTVTGALWRTNGRYFDGSDDKINCGVITTIPTANMTVEAWVKSISPDTAKRNAVWQIKADANNQVYLACPYLTTNEIHLYATVNGGAQNVGKVADLPSDMSHVVCQFVGASWSFYLNGMYINSWSKASLADLVGALTLYIGSHTDSTNQFGGLIGEVRIYNRVLSILEIQHNYLATKWRYR